VKFDVLLSGKKYTERVREQSDEENTALRERGDRQEGGEETTSVGLLLTTYY
jgi:hypothetical protein